LARALSYYERARTLDERRFAEHPNDRTAKVDFAIALSNVADAQMRLKNFTAAEPLLQRSLTIRQEVAESDPKDVFARSRVPYVHYKLAGVYEGLGDLLRALQHAERSTALWDSMLAETTTPSTSQAVHAFHYLAALQRRTGHPAACVTARRAFGLIAKLGEKTRAQMWHRDPIAEAAEQAATCGDDAARAWLASRAPAG
jgi:tetratricopeptide (TPR) repeat protein